MNVLYVESIVFPKAEAMNIVLFAAGKMTYCKKMSLTMEGVQTE